MVVSPVQVAASSLVISFSPLTNGTHPEAGHVVPEAQLGGPIALVQNGDKIIIDAEEKRIDWLVDEEMKKARQAEWDKTAPRPLRERRGVLFRYARDVAVSNPAKVAFLALTRFSLQAKEPTVIEIYSKKSQCK